jgi:hypothetical protein
MKDKGFLQDAESARLDVNPRTGAEFTSIIQEVYKATPTIVSKAQEILK